MWTEITTKLASIHIIIDSKMLMKVNSKVFQGKSQFELSFRFLKGNFKLYTGEPCEGMYNIYHPTPQK